MNTSFETAVQAVRYYAESHPRPSSVTQRQAAEMLGKSAPTVAKLIKCWKLRLNGLGQIPIWQVDALLQGDV